MNNAAGRQPSPLADELCMACILPRVCGKISGLMDF
jgi:hypothetical protein